MMARPAVPLRESQLKIESTQYTFAPGDVRYLPMRYSKVVAVTIIVLAACASSVAQARSLISTSANPVLLPGAAGQQIVLGSVSLGEQRSFTMFNIQAAGTITPDPDLNGAAFQLRFLICDRPDCTGELRTETRILRNDDATAPTQVLATRSFGVTTHSAGDVAMPALPTGDANAPLYLAVALKSLRVSAKASFRAQLNLLRVDVLP